MKKAIIGLALALFVVTGVSAQDQSGSLADRPKGRHHNLNKVEELNLTDDQKTQLKTINDDFKQQMTDLKNSEDKITVKEWKSKMTTIHKEHVAKVQNILTDEQKASLGKMKQERRADRKHHGARRLERMKKDLNLTDDQVNTLKKNHEDMEQKFKAIREDKSLTEDQKKAEVKKFKQDQHESLKSVLTPEQLQKLEQQKKQHKHQADKVGFQS